STAKQVSARAVSRIGGGGELVDAAPDAFLGAGRHGRHRVHLVVHGEVVHAVLSVFVHTTQAVLDDHCKLVRVGGIVRVQRRNHAGQHVTLSVLVLQSF